MKRGRSIGRPTKEEAAWIVEVKMGPCVACWNWPDAPITFGCDAHHLLSGGRRRGHSATIGLCPWHHRGVPLEETVPATRAIYGPSLMDGSKLFHAAYGSDDELLKVQRGLIGDSA